MTVCVGYCLAGQSVFCSYLLLPYAWVTDLLVVAIHSRQCVNHVMLWWLHDNYGIYVQYLIVWQFVHSWTRLLMYNLSEQSKLLQVTTPDGQPVHCQP